MSFTLLHDEHAPVLAAKSALIKRHEREDFESAAALLSETRRLNAVAQLDLDERREIAKAEGYREGLALAQNQIEQAIASLATQFEDFSRERKEDVAQAAYAAVQAIIGQTPDDKLLEGAVLASLTRMDGEGAVTVEVAPVMAGALAKSLHGHEHIVVKANDTLEPTACQLVTGKGRIVADVNVQMDALAKRWGVEA